MARFYVGQRVRVINRASRHFGSECKVTGVDVIAHVIDLGERGVEVDLHCTRWSCNCVFQPHELEPIVDPGREVIAWSECVWKPEHLRTEA